jgi:hypothetical protein
MSKVIFTKFDKISHFLLLLSSVKSSGIFLQIFVAWFFFLVAPNHMLKMAHIFLVFSEYLLYYWIPNVAHCYKEFNSRPKKAKGSQFSHLHYCNVCRGAHFSICKTKVLLRNQAIQSRDTYLERWLNSLISNFNFGLGLFGYTVNIYKHVIGTVSQKQYNWRKKVIAIKLQCCAPSFAKS